ncbi:hypothetical protein TNCV_2425131 [Trichonephila clavipes]|nr:hypothetical protein TNCV_2425131 [Trichonephila clavipes]
MIPELTPLTKLRQIYMATNETAVALTKHGDAQPSGSLTPLTLEELYSPYGRDDPSIIPPVHRWYQARATLVARSTKKDRLFLNESVHEQMFRSDDQSDAEPPVLSSLASLVLIYRPLKDERLSLPSPTRGLNLGHEVWKSDALPLSHRA